MVQPRVLSGAIALLAIAGCARASGHPAPATPVHAGRDAGHAFGGGYLLAAGPLLPQSGLGDAPPLDDGGIDAEPPASADDDADHALTMDEATLAHLVSEDISALGSLSVGRPTAGAIVGGVQMPEGELWETIDPSRAWGTTETIGFVVHAIERVHQLLPGGHPVYIGHISREGGGPMRPHRSHQCGRDVDLSYFYKRDMNPGWYQKASARTLDMPRTWALIRALLTETDVEYIFIDTPVQREIKRFAMSVGEDRAWLDEVFQYRSRHPAPIIRHSWGHNTHMHVRFFNRRAQGLGARAFPHLVQSHIITPGKHYARYQVHPGEGIEAVARRFGTSPDAIRRMNGLRTLHLAAGRIYAIPTRSRVTPPTVLTIPERRLPPSRPGVDALARAK